jgi:hypothetical protein
MRIAIQQNNARFQFSFHRDPKVVSVARGVDEVMIDDHLYIIEDVSYMKIYGHVLWNEKDEALSPAEKRSILENFLDSKV